MIIKNKKAGAYRSHDKYSIPYKRKYFSSINSIETNFYGDLCDISGLAKECFFSEGGRTHRFITDKYGFKTLGNLESSDIAIIGDSFLAASGGDEMNQQLGSVISSLTSIPVYEAAHPGGIFSYNKRHALLSRKKPRLKFIYLLFEGNDFIDSTKVETNQSYAITKAKPWHFLRSYYVPILDKFQDVANDINNLPLFALIKVRRLENVAENPSGRKTLVEVRALNSGRLQAFYSPYVKSTNQDLKIPSEELSYLLLNKDSICGVIFVPTAYTVYFGEKNFLRRHPSLAKQLNQIKNSGIEVVDLTNSLKDASALETEDYKIWWADDTHWNSNGIKVAAAEAVKSLRCLQD